MSRTFHNLATLAFNHYASDQTLSPLVLAMTAAIDGNLPNELPRLRPVLEPHVAGFVLGLVTAYDLKYMETVLKACQADCAYERNAIMNTLSAQKNREFNALKSSSKLTLAGLNLEIDL